MNRTLFHGRVLTCRLLAHAALCLCVCVNSLRGATLQLLPEVVETPGAVARASSGWTLNRVPELRIGQLDGPAQYTFHEIGGVLQIPGGHLLVTDRSGELRYFDRNGAFLYKAGGPGPGPGEFYRPQIIPWSADSLLIFEGQPARRRLAVMSFDGRTEIRSLTIPPQVGRVHGIANGHLLSYLNTISIVNPDLSRNEVIDVDVLVTHLDTRTSKTVATFGDLRMTFTFAEPGSRLPVSGAVPFRTPPSLAVGRDKFYVTPGDRAEVWEYDSAGELRRIFRVNEPIRNLSRAEYNAALDRYFAGIPGLSAAARQAYRQLPLPDAAAVFEHLHVDVLGWVWAKTYQLDRGQPATWILFDPNGRAHGTIELPAAVTIRHIGDDFVLLTARDEFRVEYVQRHSLVRR
jgi:hypothetical protein